MLQMQVAYLMSEHALMTTTQLHPSFLQPKVASTPGPVEKKSTPKHNYEPEL